MRLIFLLRFFKFLLLSSPAIFCCCKKIKPITITTARGTTSASQLTMAAERRIVPTLTPLRPRPPLHESASPRAFRRNNPALRSVSVASAGLSLASAVRRAKVSPRWQWAVHAPPFSSPPPDHTHHSLPSLHNLAGKCPRPPCTTP